MVLTSFHLWNSKYLTFLACKWFSESSTKATVVLCCTVELHRSPPIFLCVSSPQRWTKRPNSSQLVSAAVPVILAEPWSWSGKKKPHLWHQAALDLFYVLWAVICNPFPHPPRAAVLSHPSLSFIFSRYPSPVNHAPTGLTQCCCVNPLLPLPFRPPSLHLSCFQFCTIQSLIKNWWGTYTGNIQ